MPTIAIVNRSTVISDDKVKAIAAALQIQVKRDLRLHWPIDADVAFLPGKTKAPKDAWQLVVLDTSDQADALGYHDVTAAGLPLGKAFAKSDLEAGDDPGVTLSHELLEMLVD